MVYRPFQAVGNESDSVYGRRITGQGPTYRELLKGRVSCRESGEDMALGYIVSHMMTQHGLVAEARQSWKIPATGEGTRTYQMALPAKRDPWSCLMEG